MTKLVCWVLLAGGFILAAPAMAAEWYIDAQNGVNNSACNTAENPCATISYTLSIFSGGDTMYLKGTFSEELFLNSSHSGAEGDYTVFSSWPGEERATIGSGTSNAVTLDGASYVIISALNITGADDAGIYFENSCSNVLLEQLNVYGNAYYGIKIKSGSDIAVSNSIVYGAAGSQDTGIRVYFNASDISIINNTFYGNTDNNIYLQTVSDINIYNNILAGSTYAMQTDSNTIAGVLLSDNNDFYNNSTDVYIDNLPASLSLSQWQTLTSQDLDSLGEIDPDFISTTAGSEDFHLSPTSELIDAGMDLEAVAVDYDNETRPYGTTDIGADERPVPLAPTDYGATVFSDTAVEIYWTAPATAITSYALYIGEAADLSDAVQFSGIAFTTYDMSDLTAGTTYYAQLQSLYATDYQEYLSDYTSIFSFTLNDPTPGQVQNVKVPKKYRKAHQVKIKWDGAGEDLTYQIKLMNKKGEKIKIYNSAGLNKVIKKLKADKAYKVRVRAKYDADTVGAWSEVVKFKTLTN